MKTILIIRLSSIGDVLLTTPFIRQVKTKFPHSKIHYITKKEFTPLLKHNSYIDNLIEFDSKNGISELIQHNKNLKALNFDYIFDLHNNIRSNRLTAGVKTGYIERVRKNKYKRFFLVYFKINLYGNISSIPDKYLKTGKAAGVENDHKGLDLFFGEEELIFHKKRLNDLSLIEKGYIVFAPGATYYTKRWPLKYLKELLSQYTHQKIIILGSKQEVDSHSIFNDFSHIRNLTGELSIIESALMINSSKLVLSNDSGLMHIASALNIKQIAIF